MTASGVLALLLHAPLMAGAALLLAGLVPWALAQLERRGGPPPLEIWHDWRRLLRKQPVRPDGASKLFAAAAVVSLAATVTAALLVPSFSLGMATAPVADLLVIAGLLAVARASLTLAALDAGTAPGALAAVNGMRTGLLAEPALAAVALTLALLTSSTNLTVASLALREGVAPGAPLWLVLAGLAVVTAGETLDGTVAGFSGWHRAAAEAALALRRVVWLSLLSLLLFPASLAPPGFDLLAWGLAVLIWAAKLAVLAVACCWGGAALPRQPATLGAGLLLVVLGLLYLLTGGELT